MARPNRNDVDYFPFICKEGKGMYYIENKYGNDGFATWVKILRQLATTNYHYLNLSNESDLMFLASKCKVTEQKLEEIINDLCKLGEFNKELWDGNKILFSEKFIENIQDAYKKRNNKCVDLDSLRALLISLGVNLHSYCIENDTHNPHTILYYTKEEDSIIPETPQKSDLSKSNLFRKPIIPHFEEVHRIFVQQGGTEEMAKKFFNGHESTGWFFKGSAIINYSAMIPGFIASWNSYKKNEDKEGIKKIAQDESVKKMMKSIGL